MHPAGTLVNSVNYAPCSKFYILHYNVIQWEFQISHCYRQQRSWGKVMFLQASVILLTGEGGTPRSRHPPWNRHLPSPQSRHPPRSRHPPEQTPPRADTPQWAWCEIRSTRGWYASYWNAILFQLYYYFYPKYSFMKTCTLDLWSKRHCHFLIFKVISMLKIWNSEKWSEHSDWKFCHFNQTCSNWLLNQ